MTAKLRTPKVHNPLQGLYDQITDGGVSTSVGLRAVERRLGVDPDTARTTMLALCAQGSASECGDARWVFDHRPGRDALDWRGHVHLLGKMSDQKLSEDTGFSVSACRHARYNLGLVETRVLFDWESIKGKFRTMRNVDIMALTGQSAGAVADARRRLGVKRVEEESNKANRIRSGQKRIPSPPMDWSPVAHLFGTMSDTDLARQLDKPAETVRSARRRAKKPAYVPPKGEPRGRSCRPSPLDTDPRWAGRF